MSPVLEQIIEQVQQLSKEERDELREYLNGAAPRQPVTDRERLVRELCGKYAHLPGSVDDFIRRKQEDIEWENRHWPD